MPRTPLALARRRMARGRATEPAGLVPTTQKTKTLTWILKIIQTKKTKLTQRSQQSKQMFPHNPVRLHAPLHLRPANLCLMATVRSRQQQPRINHSTLARLVHQHLLLRQWQLAVAATIPPLPPLAPLPPRLPKSARQVLRMASGTPIHLKAMLRIRQHPRPPT